MKSRTLNVPTENSLVLVVDDDEAMRLLLRRAMQKEGFRVIEGQNGLECLALFRQSRPDLVLLDGMMPVMDGFAACAQLQELPGGDRTPVLLITGLNDNDSVDEAFKAGATDYITKPIHWAVLRQRVRRLIAGKQSEELRDDLTHMIIHDMKNPIAAINGYSETLLAGLKGELSPTQAEAVARVYRNSAVLLDMTRMILDLKKMEEGRLNLDYSYDLLGDALQKVCDGLSWLAESRQIEIRIEDDPEAIASLDWDLIGRVLTNLVTNAIKHSPRGAVVWLSGGYAPSEAAGGGEKRVVFSVKDEGEGIAEQDRQLIFDKYVQAQGRRGGSHLDTGLGLTFCKLAVEAHGGTIELESKLGLGSTFRLYLPAEGELNPELEEVDRLN